MFYFIKISFKIAIILMLVILFPLQSQTKLPSSIYDFKMTNIDKKPLSLSQFKNQVIMIVNVASQCGYTPQYKDLQKLYDTYKEKGFVIIGVPSNSFFQESKSEEQIKSFCKLNYNVTFPLTKKVTVKGKQVSPLYTFLTSKKTNPHYSGEIAWNFTKFIIDRNGAIIARFEPHISPADKQVIKTIKSAILKRKTPKQKKIKN